MAKKITEVLQKIGDSIVSVPLGSGGTSVELSDAIDSDSSTAAASSKAVKTAYDKAVLADNNADTAKNMASSAQTKANSAYTLANSAQENANTAQSTATAAKTNADKVPNIVSRVDTLEDKVVSATTSRAGLVKLNNTVTSTSTTEAATAKVVKTTYDKIEAIENLTNSIIPAGTKMLFAQASAPSGWVKQTTVNDAAVRIVSGTTGGGTGGSIAFSTLFAAGKTVTLSGNVGATTLTVGQSALHQHATCQGLPYNSNEGFPTGENPSPNKKGLGGTWYAAEKVIYTWASSDTGGSQSHTHTLSGKATIALNVKYIDVIICAKA